MSRKSHAISANWERPRDQRLLPAWMIAELQKHQQVQIPLYAPMPQPIAPHVEPADEDDWITL